MSRLKRMGTISNPFLLTLLSRELIQQLQEERRRSWDQQHVQSWFSCAWLEVLDWHATISRTAGKQSALDQTLAFFITPFQWHLFLPRNTPAHIHSIWAMAQFDKHCSTGHRSNLPIHRMKSESQQSFESSFQHKLVQETGVDSPIKHGVFDRELPKQVDNLPEIWNSTWLWNQRRVMNPKDSFDLGFLGVALADSSFHQQRRRVADH